MITCAHVMIFTNDEEADRAALHDVLAISCIDSGEGWAAFKLQPAELGVHSGNNGSTRSISSATTPANSSIAEESWGTSTGVKLPGGGTFGIYQAPHARP